MESKTLLVSCVDLEFAQNIANYFSKNNYNIIIALDTQEKEFEAVNSSIKNTVIYKVNHNSYEDIQRLVSQVEVEFKNIDMFVCCNSKILYNYVSELSTAQLDELYNYNYKSYLLYTQAIAKNMIKYDVKGSMVYITSFHGVRAYAYDCVFGSFSAALHRSSESLALQLSAYGIRLNNIAIGANCKYNKDIPFEYGEYDKRIPLSRYLSYEDIFNSLEFLLSEKSSYITGTVVKLDGGITLAGMPESDIGYGWDKNRKEFGGKSKYKHM